MLAPFRPSPAARPRARVTASASGERHDGGFILVEVLVAALIFTIVTTAAVLAITSGSTASSVTQQRVTTTNLVQQAVQQAMKQPVTDLAATPTATSTATVGAGQYRLVRTTSLSPAGATACPTVPVLGTPYALTVHVAGVALAPGARTVEMETVVAC